MKWWEKTKVARSHLGRRLAISVLPSGLVDPLRERRRLAREAAASARVRASSWEEARAKAGSYDADMLNRFIVARAAGHIPKAPEGLLGLVARLIGQESLTVTDFGGSCGTLGLDFLTAYPASTYTVVETGALVAMAPAGPVRFSTQIPDQCDVFYSSGTLQYVARPYDVLKKAVASARVAIVLRRNNFSLVERFEVQISRLFEHGAGLLPDGFEDCEITYPRRTLVEAEVVDFICCHGFRCIASLDEKGGAGDGYGRQLVFMR